MAKKCRVYKPQSMQRGGQAVITQDSQKDDISGQKTNNFMKWLHRSSEGVKVQQEFEQDMQMLDMYAQYGGDMQSGFQSGNYGQMNPLHMDAYQNAVNNQPSTIQNITDFSNLAGAFAQYGQEVSYPGYGLQLMPEIDDSLMLLPEEDTETVDKILGKQPNIEDTYTTYPAVDERLPNEADYTTGATSDETKKSKGRFGSIGMDPRNTNKAQAMIAGMNVLTAFGSMDEAAAEKKRLEQKQSDVFQNFATVGSDRGDYLANAPGIGINFRPDQHTRMGYNTKIAQEGLEVDSELELTEEQINDLIAQGYNLEYLD